MRSILWLNPNRIELNALFIQPTRWCGNKSGCAKECYVKNHSEGEESFHTSWQEQWKLFNLFYKGPHWANQITISVDDLHNDPHKSKHMSLLIDSILLELQTDKRDKSERPEVHMTLHTLETFRQYRDLEIRGWEKLDMISFSELPTIRPRPISIINYFRANKVPINYNKLVKFTTNWEKEIFILESISKFVDSIYLVMHKTPIGIEPSALSQNSMASYLLYVSEVVDKLSKDARNKVRLDGCMQDTAQHSRTGFGCSSNISRFQVWPNGTVSGCPYAKYGSGENAGHAEGILGNIRKARKRYEFKELCYLPDLYSDIKGRSSLRVL